MFTNAEKKPESSYRKAKVAAVAALLGFAGSLAYMTSNTSNEVVEAENFQADTLNMMDDLNVEEDLIDEDLEEDAVVLASEEEGFWAQRPYSPSRVHKEEPFTVNDPFFSNQGAAGTCVRHAVAKGVQREITYHTKNNYVFNTAAVVQWLVDHKHNGAEGAWPQDYSGARGQIIGDDGHVYTV